MWPIRTRLLHGCTLPTGSPRWSSCSSCCIGDSLSSTALPALRGLTEWTPTVTAQSSFQSGRPSPPLLLVQMCCALQSVSKALAELTSSPQSSSFPPLSPTVRILMGFQAKIWAPSWSPSLLPVRSEISSASGVPFLPTLPLLCLSLTFYYGKPHTHSKIGKTVQQTLVFQLPRFLRVNTRPVVFHLFSYQSLWSKSQTLYHFIYKCFRMYLKGFF